jgi:hypothetical protein
MAWSPCACVVFFRSLKHNKTKALGFHDFLRQVAFCGVLVCVWDEFQTRSCSPSGFAVCWACWTCSPSFLPVAKSLRVCHPNPSAGFKRSLLIACSGLTIASLLRRCGHGIDNGQHRGDHLLDDLLSERPTGLFAGGHNL